MFHPQGPSFLELARQALSSTERGYDLLAPKFDFTPFRTPDVILRRVQALLPRDGEFESALDLCCGTGAASEMLLRLRPRRLVGIDMSDGMLAMARRRVTPVVSDTRCENRPGGENQSGAERDNVLAESVRAERVPAERVPAERTPVVQFVRGNVLDMPFHEEFDIAVCFGALGHILPRDETRFIEQIHNVLRPGGRFVFVTSEMPRCWSLRYLASRGFNAAMHLRNLVVRPSFVMFYLTFLIPNCLTQLRAAGFEIEVKELDLTGPFQALRAVIATRPGVGEERRD